MDKTGKLQLADQGIDNLTNLVELSDQSLLSNLQIRYSQKLIYTYIGSILISINPYTELGIYEKKHIIAYQNKSMQDMPPHLFGIGEINYSKMMMENENQVIVISGESGAGKTESFKRLLAYFAYVSGGFKETKQNADHLSNDIATKILDSTPLLESFGNAQTIRNDNSSRFGKYVEIFFDNGNICGSRITNYLLEKSRIVNISSKERGYHIFYEILLGLDSFHKSQYHFKEIKDYSYLNRSKDFTIKDRNDATNLNEFMKQWDSLGLSSEDMDVTMRILSAVLHLGNIKFMEEQEASYLVETENIGIVAKMLKVDIESLKHCLTMKTTETVKDAASSPLNKKQSINYRDTLAKHLYSELFNWIVANVNVALNQNNMQARRSSVVDKSLMSSTSKFRCIAMLDIYGFENFPENSLEQLCINYANETLQQFFNRYVFELEQAEYKQEGISWHYISYPDNQPIIDLLSAKPNGIIQILNDECSIPQGSDEAFLNKCHNVYSKNENYEKPKKIHPPQFIIHHFAGNISYSVNGFLEKNRDVLRKEILNVIEHCGVDEVATMFRNKRELQTKNPIAKARTPAVMGDFQNSLNTLLTKMKTCQPWFIRCLKPNATKEALKFNKDIVMDQMKYTGILETVKIRKSGFPIRILFSVFLSRFYLLVTKEIRKASQGDQQEACLKLMLKFKGVKKKHFEIGKTKLFLKEEFARHLEKQVQIIRNRSAIIIQRKWRAYWKIRQIIIQNEAATKIQAVVRGFLDRRRIKRLQEGIIKLQAYVRMRITRKKFLDSHPEFLKLSIFQMPTEISETYGPKLTAYKIPASQIPKKTKRNKKKTIGSPYNYDLLKIPIELAFLLDKSTEKLNQNDSIPLSDQIVQTGRAQHLWNRGEYKLPDDIDQYVMANYLDENGNNIPFDSKSKPITAAYLCEIDTPDFKDDALIAHKLILRILYAKSMPWFHRFLTNSYLQYLGSKSTNLQKEIFVQILAETFPSKVIRSKFQSDNEDIRLSRAWTLLGNFLSFIVPCPDIHNYILKCVSDCVGVDQAVTCQEKLLHLASAGLPLIPRLFPATTLESAANKKGAKTCLNVMHPDNKSNSVHLNSFTIAEDFASHSLCFRMKRYKLMKGWSISLIYQDVVYDCSGQNYILDIISGLELPQQWSKITNQSLEKRFLISRSNKANGETPEVSARGYIKNVYKPPKVLPSNKPASTVNSLHSMDSWVDKNFGISFSGEDTSNIPFHNLIHGLEDELQAKGKVQYSSNPNISSNFPTPLNGYESNPNLAFAGQTNLHYAPEFHLPRTNVNTMYFPATSTNDFDMLQDPTYLQEQLNSVQLENKVIQSSIEREILQSRLQKIKQQKYLQQPGFTPNFQMQYSQQYQPIPTLSMPNNINRYHLYPQYNQPSFPNQYTNHEPFLNSVQFSNNIPNTQMHSVPNFNIFPPQDNQIPPNSQNPKDQIQSNQFQNTQSNETPNKPRLSVIDLQNVKLKPISNSVPPPPAPPPPPPNQTGISGGGNSGQSQINNQNALKHDKSIVKYSEVGQPSTTVVNDKDILPEIKVQEDKKSYLRAAEVPKVNVNSRAVFLENFFKDKQPISDKPIGPPKKRKITLIPKEEKSFPENQSNAIDLLSSLNNSSKLLPRPSMFGKELKESTGEFIKSTKTRQVSINDKPEEVNYESRLPRINVDSNKSEKFPVPLPRSNTQNDKYTTPSKKIKKYVSSTKADILCGLPDMRYYTYQKIPWFILLKREIYLPNEIQNTTILNPMIFCQIVRDLVEFSCIRWVGNEKQRLLSMLGNQVIKDINSILAVPTNIMLRVIDEALKCELYFSRFYEIQWPTHSDNDNICHWMAISHTGIRFVQQNIRSPLSSLSIESHISYNHVTKVSCKDRDQYNNPQILVITTKSRKKFKVKTIHATSAESLILEFIKQNEIEKTHGTINLSTNTENIKRKRSLLQDNTLFTESGTTMLGVNNERIQMQGVKNNNYNNDKINKDFNKIPNQVKKQGNLIDFTVNYSKHKDYQHVSNVILRYQEQCITEPILQFTLEGISRQAIEIHRFLLQLSEDYTSDRNSNPISSANLVFTLLLQNEELNEEIILQIFKQINGNPSMNASKFLWNLLSIIILFIGPTKRIQPFLLEHLNQIVNNQSNQDLHMAAYAIKNFNIIRKNGTRKEMPTEKEFQQMMTGTREIDVGICVPHETASFTVSFNNLIEDVVKMICETMDISSKLEIIEYVLVVYETDKNNFPIRVKNYLAQDLFFFDIYNSLFKQKGQNYILKFCRKTWTVPLNLEMRSQNFIAFHFNQLSKDILNEDWLIPSKNQTLNSNDSMLLAKIAYCNMRGQGRQKLKNDETLKLLLPNKLFDKKKILSKKNIIKSMNSETDNKKTMELVEFQKTFLELLEKLPKFGNIKYPVNGVKQIKIPGQCFINFNSKSISFSNEDSQESINFLIKDFISFQCSSQNEPKALFNIRYKNNEEIEFNSINGIDIRFLLSQYQLIKRLQSGEI